MPSRRALSSVLIAGAAICPVSAQHGPSASERPRTEITPYVGVAVDSPVGHHFGVTPDRNHVFFGIHGLLHLFGSKRVVFGYAPDVVPLLLVSNNPGYRVTNFPNGRPASMTPYSGLVAGLAVSPIGVETLVRLCCRWDAYAGGATGVAWFSRDVPVIGSRAFNYTFEFGGGARRTIGRTVVRLGYKFHHLSNAYTAPANPGLDGHVFMLGIGRSFGK